MNSVGSSPGMNRLPRTRQPGGGLSVRSRPQLLTLTWCISDGVLPRNVSPIHTPGDPAVSMPRMTMGADAEPCARSDPAPYLPNVSPEVSANSTVAPASIVRVPRTESRPCTTCGDSARVHVSLAVIDNVSLVQCGPSGLPRPSGSHAPPPGSAPPRLAFTVQPTDALKDSMITPPVQVTVFDSAGNVMTSFTGDVTLALGKDPSVPKARLSGRSQAAASGGVATFPDLSIDQIDDGYTLVATIGGGEVSQESTPFNITAVPSPGPGSARTLSFTQQPQTTAAGTAIPPVQVAALDSAGHRVTTFTGPITVSLGANPGGDPLAPQTVNAVNGLATFSNLRIDKAASGYSLVATGSGLPNATSTVFTIVPGTATQLVFTVPPSNTPARATIQPPVQVTAYDAFGNRATNFTGSVLVAIGRNGGLLVPGTLSGNGAVPAVSGVATFSNLSIDVVGNGYTLTAAFAGGAVVVESPSFNITVL